MSGEYLAGLRIRIEPGSGAVASLREVLLVVPTVEPGQEGALDALLAAATHAPVARGVARVVADVDREQLPAFALVVAGEDGGPFVLVHGAARLVARGDGQEIRLSGLESRLWVEQALPPALDELEVLLVEGGAERTVLWATADPAGSQSVAPPAHTRPAHAGAPTGHAVEPLAAPSPLSPGAGSQDGAGSDDVMLDDDVRDVVPVDFARADEAPDDDLLDDELADDDLLDDDTSDGDTSDGDTPDGDTPDGPVPGDGDVHRGRAVIPAPAAAPLGAGSSSAPFRPEPVRFGDGGRMEAVTPPTQINGWHEPPAVLTPPDAADPAASVASAAPAAPAPIEPPAPSPLSAAAPPAPQAPPDPFARHIPPNPFERQSPPDPFARHTPPDPFALQPPDPFAPPADPFAPPTQTPPRAPESEPSAPQAPPAPPTRSPQASLPPNAATQVVPPPGSGLFTGPVPPPMTPGFDPFAAAAPRPPGAELVGEPSASRVLGRLVMENGPEVVVDSDCVIGRNPEVDPDVASGRAKPVVLPDEEQRISRVHARLVFGEDGVEILDAGSVNGTWIEPPDGDGWIAMVPRVAAPLPLGSRIQVGDLVLSYLPAAGEG